MSNEVCNRNEKKTGIILAVLALVVISSVLAVLCCSCGKKAGATTFVLDGESIKIENEAYVEFTPPKKDGYRFAYFTFTDPKGTKWRSDASGAQWCKEGEYSKTVSFEKLKWTASTSEQVQVEAHYEKIGSNFVIDGETTVFVQKDSVLQLPATTKKHYLFLGYSLEMPNGDVYYSNESGKLWCREEEYDGEDSEFGTLIWRYADLTMEAESRFSPKTYAVYLDTDNGKPEQRIGQVVYGTREIASLNAWTSVLSERKDGHMFAGLMCVDPARKGPDRNVTANMSITFLAAFNTLNDAYYFDEDKQECHIRIRWEETPFTLYLYDEGGTYLTQYSLKYNSELELTYDAPARAGKKQVGWSSSLGGQVTFFMRDTFRLAARNNQTLYAVWEDNPAPPELSVSDGYVRADTYEGRQNGVTNVEYSYLDKNEYYSDGAQGYVTFDGRIDRLAAGKTYVVRAVRIEELIVTKKNDTNAQERIRLVSEYGYVVVERKALEKPVVSVENDVVKYNTSEDVTGTVWIDGVERSEDFDIKTLSSGAHEVTVRLEYEMKESQETFENDVKVKKYTFGSVLSDPHEFYVMPFEYTLEEEDELIRITVTSEYSTGYAKLIIYNIEGEPVREIAIKTLHSTGITFEKDYIAIQVIITVKSSDSTIVSHTESIWYRQ